MLRSLVLAGLAGLIALLPAVPAAAATAPDPLGGPAWSTSLQRDGSCVAAGQRAGGRRVRVVAGGRRIALRPGELRTCGGPPGRRESALLVRELVDDPAAARPRKAALLVAGLAGRDAVTVRLRTAGLRRAITPDRRTGAWIAVLPRPARQADLGISIRYRDGKVDTSDFGRGRPRFAPRPGSVRVEQAVADPTRPVPQGQLVWETRGGQRCQHVGDLVAGDVGWYQPGPGAFTPFPVRDGGSCTVPARLPVPAGVGITTNPGRLLLSGFVRADVTALAIGVGGAEPAPVRLTRRRAFALAVALPGTSLAPPVVVLRSALRDGRTVEQRYPPTG